MNVSDVGAVVTGGHSGMGFAAARLLAEQGARVTILGRRADLVKQKAEAIGALGIGCDISDPAAVDAALDEAERANGPSRILINAAAIGTLFTVLDPDGSPASLENMRRQLEVNVLGTLIMDRAIASRLTKVEPVGNGVRGVIVNVSSIAAQDGIMGASYCASKGGVDGIALSLARELSQWGIRVCTIAPGSIETEMFLDGATPQRFEIVRRHTPSGRLGRPEEFATLALQICENDFLNGCNIRLDGGFRVPFSVDVGINRTEREL